MGNDVCLGLGSELVTARTVEGRFPNINQVIPKQKPLFTFSFDPKTLAETLLAWPSCCRKRTGGSSCSTTATACPSASAPGTSTTASLSTLWLRR
jgi:hypothetical protein